MDNDGKHEIPQLKRQHAVTIATVNRFQDILETDDYDREIWEALEKLLEQLENKHSNKEKTNKE